MPYTETGVGFQRTDTSYNAANEVDAGTIRKKVIVLLREMNMPLTSEDITAMLGLPYPSVQPRLSELRSKNLVEDSGERGLSQYGKAIIKWQVVSEDFGDARD